MVMLSLPPPPTPILVKALISSLTVDYREYTYAGGRIPGGFIKREGRPSERKSFTVARLTARFAPVPDGFRCETR
jgi:polyribonucleotide nucleotidyltransferase